jgi:hypothetical protein
MEKVDMLTFGWGAESIPDGFSSSSGLYLIRVKWNGDRVLCAVSEEVIEDILGLKLPPDKCALSDEVTKRLRAKFLTVATEERLLSQIGSTQMPGFLLSVQDF